MGVAMGLQQSWIWAQDSPLTLKTSFTLMTSGLTFARTGRDTTCTPTRSCQPVKFNTNRTLLPSPCVRECFWNHMWTSKTACRIRNSTFVHIPPIFSSLQIPAGFRYRVVENKHLHSLHPQLYESSTYILIISPSPHH